MTCLTRFLGDFALESNFVSRETPVGSVNSARSLFHVKHQRRDLHPQLSNHILDAYA